MAVYTHLSNAELDAFLEGYDLGAPRSFKGIAEGVENSNFFLETQAGRFILTLYERRARREDLPFFLGFMGHLAAAGFPAPTPIADRRGRVLQDLAGRPAALVSFMPGVSLTHPGAPHCREVGAALARMHRLGEGFAGRRSNDLGRESWRPLFEPLAGAADRLEPGLSRRIREDLDRIDADWPAGAPRGLVHADLFPDNVFFIDDRFAAAIDFYFACEDALAYDLAVCLNAWCFADDARLDPERTLALISGYETERPLADLERRALPTLAFGAAMRFFLTRLADWERPADGALVRPKNPLEYARKLEAHRAGRGRLDLYGVRGGL